MGKVLSKRIKYNVYTFMNKNKDTINNHWETVKVENKVRLIYVGTLRSRLLYKNDERVYLLIR